MTAGHVATAEVDISASPDQVWSALTDPSKVKRYFFDSTVETDWQPGSPIVWRGEWDDKPYEDKGQVIEVVPHERLKVTHFSPLSGATDQPEHYHELEFELDHVGPRTHVTFTQSNNPSDEAAEHAAEHWRIMLDGLKELVERG